MMCPRFPIIQMRDVPVNPTELKRIKALAQTIASEDRHIVSASYFGGAVRPGIDSGPAILIGDKSEIKLLAPAGQDPLEYRIFLLAQSGDVAILATDRSASFENYLSELLGINPIEVLEMPEQRPGRAAANAVRCVEDPGLFGHLLRHTVANAGVTIIPYVSTGSIWNLAKRLSEKSGHSVSVAAARPNLARKVNDKLWFANVARTLFGLESIPPVQAAHGLAALTGYVQQFAKKWDKLVIKVPDSAGSAGNFPIDSSAIRELGAKAVREYILELTSPVLTAQDYPLMVEVWDCDVVANPSVQIWIPTANQGKPVIEGVYDQVLIGAQAKFVGAGPSTLNKKQDHLLCRQAMQLALLFQELGYFGRCSFDTVVSRNEDGNEELHWIECNGRWGGVSLPMTFMNRMFPEAAVPDYVVVQLSRFEATGMSFDKVLERIGDDLFDPNKESEGVIFTTPGGTEQSASLHMIAIGKSLDRAKKVANRVQRIFTD